MSTIGGQMKFPMRIEGKFCFLVINVCSPFSSGLPKRIKLVSYTFCCFLLLLLLLLLLFCKWSCRQMSNIHYLVVGLFLYQPDQWDIIVRHCGQSDIYWHMTSSSVKSIELHTHTHIFYMILINKCAICIKLTKIVYKTLDTSQRERWFHWLHTRPLMACCRKLAMNILAFDACYQNRTFGCHPKCSAHHGIYYIRIWPHLLVCRCHPPVYVCVLLITHPFHQNISIILLVWFKIKPWQVGIFGSVPFQLINIWFKPLSNVWMSSSYQCFVYIFIFVIYI